MRLRVYCRSRFEASSRNGCPNACKYAMISARVTAINGRTTSMPVSSSRRGAMPRRPRLGRDVAPRPAQRQTGTTGRRECGVQIDHERLVGVAFVAAQLVVQMGEDERMGS